MHTAPQHGTQGRAQSVSAEWRTIGHAHPVAPTTCRAVPTAWNYMQNSACPSHNLLDPQAKTKACVSSDEPPLSLRKPGVAPLGLVTPTLTVCSRMAGLVSRKPCTTWGKIWVLTVGSSRYWMNCSICGPGWGMRRQSALLPLTRDMGSALTWFLHLAGTGWPGESPEAPTSHLASGPRGLVRLQGGC